MPSRPVLNSLISTPFKNRSPGPSLFRAGHSFDSDAHWCRDRSVQPSFLIFITSVGRSKLGLFGLVLICLDLHVIVPKTKCCGQCCDALSGVTHLTLSIFPRFFAESCHLFTGSRSTRMWLKRSLSPWDSRKCRSPPKSWTWPASFQEVSQASSPCIVLLGLPPPRF